MNENAIETIEAARVDTNYIWNILFNDKGTEYIMTSDYTSPLFSIVEAMLTVSPNRQ